MGETLQHHSRNVRAAVLVKVITVGLIGGLAGTIAMDLLRAGLFSVLGIPVNVSFSVIGDAAAGFLSMLGISVTGGALLGGMLYYLIGLVLGGIIAITLHSAGGLRALSSKKQIGLSILFVEIMSVPMLVVAAIALKMTVSQTAQWFGISFVMHLMYGLVLGIVAVYGLRRIFAVGQ